MLYKLIYPPVKRVAAYIDKHVRASPPTHSTTDEQLPRQHHTTRLVTATPALWLTLVVPVRPTGRNSWCLLATIPAQGRQTLACDWLQTDTVGQEVIHRLIGWQERSFVSETDQYWEFIYFLIEYKSFSYRYMTQST